MPWLELKSKCCKKVLHNEAKACCGIKKITTMRRTYLNSKSTQKSTQVTGNILVRKGARSKTFKFFHPRMIPLNVKINQVEDIISCILCGREYLLLTWVGLLSRQKPRFSFTKPLISSLALQVDQAVAMLLAL